jgi:hypothetical protein
MCISAMNRTAPRRTKHYFLPQEIILTHMGSSPAMTIAGGSCGTVEHGIGPRTRPYHRHAGLDTAITALHVTRFDCVVPDATL